MRAGQTRLNARRAGETASARREPYPSYGAPLRYSFRMRSSASAVFSRVLKAVKRK